MKEFSKSKKYTKLMHKESQRRFFLESFDHFSDYLQDTMTKVNEKFKFHQFIIEK